MNKFDLSLINVISAEDKEYILNIDASVHQRVYLYGHGNDLDYIEPVSHEAYINNRSDWSAYNTTEVQALLQ